MIAQVSIDNAIGCFSTVKGKLLRFLCISASCVERGGDALIVGGTSGKLYVIELSSEDDGTDTTSMTLYDHHRA